MGQARMIKDAPRTLVVLLAAVVAARIAIVFVVHSPWSTALAWSGLLAALSLAALLGKHRAAQALAWLCIVLGLDALIQLFFAEVPAVHLAAALVWAFLVMGVGIFILRSPAVQRFYAQGSASPE
ncbi:hypothetical protein [Aquabacterium sp.]|uniref:hypothetical protein n=1 Tax=Aquabacterium sp. TaxID=1872578 RepID=UPI003D6D65C8